MTTPDDNEDRDALPPLWYRMLCFWYNDIPIPWQETRLEIKQGLIDLALGAIRFIWRMLTWIIWIIIGIALAPLFSPIWRWLLTP